MRVFYFGLTGIGSVVLEGLVKSSLITEVQVATRRESYNYPCFTCEDIESLCCEFGLVNYVDEEMEAVVERVQEFAPDFVLVCTFHKKIPKDLVECAKVRAFNVHPSLLPFFRGPMPTNWAIILGEKVSGFSVHALTDDFDMGDIFFRESMVIDEKTDGELRLALARQMARRLPEMLCEAMETEVQVERQRREDGSYYPRLGSKRGLDILKAKRFDRGNLIRGVTPYPGVCFLEGKGLL